MVTNLQSISPREEVCQACIVGKHTKNSYPDGKSKRAHEILEMVHAYLCGPMRTKLLLEANTFFYLGKIRAELVGFTFSNSMVEKQEDKNLKVLRTVRRHEFLSNKFSEFCDEHEIKRELTIPYSPEQNGVDENKNRTVEDSVKKSNSQVGEYEEEFQKEPQVVGVTLVFLQSSTLTSLQSSSVLNLDSNSSSSSRDSSPRKYKSLDEIYASNQGLLVLFARDPVSVEEAMENHEWWKEMEEELQAI
ncbi:retrovirus-related pol polyprotein from transposon TNT 1-94 [Tanacetum coccineum]